MRFATIATPSGPRAAVYHDNSYIDVHATDTELPASVRLLLEGGRKYLNAVADIMEQPKAVRYPADTVKLLPPIPDPRKIVCVGLNYRDHAEESGAPLPKEPVLFSKFATALTSHEAAIVLPPVSNEVDYEAELVIVIGQRGRWLSEQTALEHIAGYTAGHDVSARDWQLRKDGKQWLAGKTFDTFAPLGPVFVSKDEIGDPQNLDITLRLNGTTMQSSNTRQMIFSVAQIVSYLSQIVTVEPGDLIFTGTPSGVGFTRKPPVFLKGGDVVEVEISRIGVLRNSVVQG